MASSKKNKAQFRGITVKFADSFVCKDLPENLVGLKPNDFRLDRWQPVKKSDKIASNELIERNLNWINTGNDQVIYGLERWGALIPNEYTEWFSIVIIRPHILPPLLALSLAEQVTPIGFSHE